MRLSLKSLTRPLATVLLVSGAAIALGSQPSRAQQNTFVCAVSPRGADNCCPDPTRRYSRYPVDF